MALAGSKMVLGKGHSRATLLKSRGMAYKPNSLPSDKGIRASLKDASDNTLTAVVVGGGMSGLSAAQSLSRTFGRVILLERDTPASNWKPEQEYAIQDPHIRRGVPQYRFLHAYLTKGIQVLEALFPGFLEELHRNGAETVEFRKGFCQISPTYGEAPLAGHWENDLREPLSLTTTTRHTVEQTTRHLLSLNSAVEMRYGTVVKELLQEKSPVTGQGAVVGVCLTSGEEIRGDLVVDASGKNSGIAKALLDGKVEGMMKVETEQVDAKTIYYMR